ncbi:MAG: AsmA family protein, partial [Gammaproteobacteria bacterium]|nr:AsmA family protein [Gammaproteobacteria bacterium]
MTKTLKAITYAAGGLIGLLVLAAIALSLFLDINAYKPRLEAAVAAVTGMEVSVNGRLGVDFFPGLQVTLEDLHIRNRGTELVTVSKARIGLDFIALLNKSVRIREVVLEHPGITIERGRDGRFNYERTDTVRGPLPGLSLAKLSFTDGTFRYVDRQSGKGFE